MGVLISIQSSYATMRVPSDLGLLRNDEAILTVILVAIGAIALASQVQGLLRAAASAATAVQTQSEALREAQRRMGELDLHALALEQARRNELIGRTLNGKAGQRPVARRPKHVRPMAISEAEEDL